MFLDLEHRLTSSNAKFGSKPDVQFDKVGAFTLSRKSSLIFNNFDHFDNKQFSKKKTETDHSDPNRGRFELVSNSEELGKSEVSLIEINDVTESSSILRKSSEPETDLVLNWTDDLEITVRFIKDKRVNPNVVYQLFPLPENLRKIPNAETLDLR
jgi:hypothetical protein